MNQEISKKLERLGFEQKLETLFSLTIDEKYFASKTTMQVFAYFENGNYYFSDNGDMVESFDAPDIDIDFVFEKIQNMIAKHGCSLHVSKIVKTFTSVTLENDFKNFIFALQKVNKLSTEI